MKRKKGEEINEKEKGGEIKVVFDKGFSDLLFRVVLFIFLSFS